MTVIIKEAHKHRMLGETSGKVERDQIMQAMFADDLELQFYKTEESVLASANCKEELVQRWVESNPFFKRQLGN